MLSANDFGFIGNRMLFDYAREAVGLAEEGVPPYRIDAAMKNFGFAMGPFAMFDLSGIDVFWHIKQARPDMGAARTTIVDRLYEQKRPDRKPAKGFIATTRPSAAGANRSAMKRSKNFSHRRRAMPACRKIQASVTPRSSNV